MRIRSFINNFFFRTSVFLFTITAVPFRAAARWKDLSIRMMYLLKYAFVFLLLRPIFRLFLALVCNFVFAAYAPCADIPFYFSGSLEAGSSAHSNSINSVNAPIPEPEYEPLPNNDLVENPPQIPLPLDPVDNFRMLNFDMELELFARIRLLENRLIDNLPPQLNLGEYETLVRQFLDQTLTIDHYSSTILRELFDIKIMELKADLNEKLFNCLLGEPEARLIEIFSQSPFGESKIREEALDFLNNLITSFNLVDPRSDFDQRVLESLLRYWIQDVQQNAHRSAFYLSFLRHFRGDL